MARLLGPDDGQRGTQRPGGRDAARGASVVVYAASSGDTLADILTEAGEAIPDSTVTTDLDYGLIPKFQFPDGVDTVYVEVAGGARTEVNARYEARVDSLVSRVATLETTTQVLDGDLTTIAGLDSTTAGALVTDGSGWIRKTYAQLKTALGLVKADVGLGNVDNTADTAKPVSTAMQTALDLKAPLASPALTGTPTVNGATIEDRTHAAGTYVTVVEHGATAGTARPAGAGEVLWIGTVDPTAATTDDLLIRTDSSSLFRYDGASWDALGGGAGDAASVAVTPVGGLAATDVQAALAELDSEKSNGDIANFLYAPVGGVTLTTTSATMVDVDATNVLVTFTAPPSGVVWLQVNCQFKAPNPANAVIGFREGTTTVAQVAAGYALPELWYHSFNMRVAGLTPGSAHTYKLAWRVSGGGTTTIFANDGSVPLTIRVTPGK